MIIVSIIIFKKIMQSKIHKDYSDVKLQQLTAKGVNNQQEDLQNAQISQMLTEKSLLHKRIIYLIAFIALALSLLALKYLGIQTSQQASQLVDDKEQLPKSSENLFQNPKQYEHDSNCYTQGLSFIKQNLILQSCGLYQRSYIRILQYKSASSQSQMEETYKSKIYKEYLFFEGSVLFPKNQLVYVLTWRQQKVLRFQYKNGQLIEKDRLNWDKQGWGLTHNQTHLIISDGTNKIYVTDENLSVVRIIDVYTQLYDKVENTPTSQLSPIVMKEEQFSNINTISVNKFQKSLPQWSLNELQFVEQNGKQFVYANVYPTNKIVKIDYSTGRVVRTYTLDNIVNKEPQANSGEVLNGIAFNTKRNQFLLTGKKWEHFYLISSF